MIYLSQAAIPGRVKLS